MPSPLNPFLAAFFRSALPAQCTPISNHVLLVPTTEILLTHRETESGHGLAELPHGALDEFLASHVIRMPNARVAAAAANAAGGKDGVVNLREIRGKAKPYGTLNGRSVIIKDNMVYSHKGFKSHTHAVLLSDTVWYGDTLEPRPWLVYYISRPLIGSWEEIKIVPAILGSGQQNQQPQPQQLQQQKPPSAAGKTSAVAAVEAGASVPRKKDIKSFHELLNHFPAIARQMQPGLDKIFREFSLAFLQRFPPPPTASHVPDPEPDGPIKTAMKRARLDSAVVVAAGTAGDSGADNTNAPSGAGDVVMGTDSLDNNTKTDTGADTTNNADSTARGGNSGTGESDDGGNGDDGTTEGRGSGSRNNTLTPTAVESSGSSIRTDGTNGTNGSGSGSSSQGRDEFYPEDDEHVMRASLESAVTTAIDVFQSVDKQQLSLLGATTDLTGPLVERLIERYVSENVHHIIFPRLTALKRQEDLELESKIRQMDCVDISQLGIDIDGGARSKHEVTIALGRAVEEFRKMPDAACPQEMVSLLLSTVKSVTQVASPSTSHGSSGGGRPEAAAEKPLLTVNADTLVSLLLFVVIRAQQKHLLARFAYMRHFIFIDDVDTGEVGYALSTFEAVLSYLARDSSGLRRVSRRNKALWEATAKGDLAALKEILEPSFPAMQDGLDEDEDGGGGGEGPSRRPSSSAWATSSSSSSSGFAFPAALSSGRSSLSSRRSSLILSESDTFSTGSGLGHVFPFQAQDDGGDSGTDGGDSFPAIPIKRIKHVALDTRSMSSSSEISFRSRATSFASTFGSGGVGTSGDTSVSKLSQTHNAFGESLLMMAVQNEQVAALNYLLGLEDCFPASVVLDDINHEETTLLSAAVQLGHEALIMAVMGFLTAARTVDAARLAAYFAVQDIWGRSVAHYLFHAPFLIGQYGRLMPWRQRDKNGQTPLFALCRSYDHGDYHGMVESGLGMATAMQGDGQRLHVDEHVDGRGNTLLHIINDAQLAQSILQRCDVDVNAVNDKRFTPLMVASKYGRFDMVRTLFADARVDMGAKELRGLTAVELAKDDEVRNKIDDLTLLSLPAGPEGRTTAVVRAYFVEDASVRFVLKSGAAVSAVSYAVTTCRRSLADFERLGRLLALEQPASWIPAVVGDGLRTPFQIPSKPSRAALKELQVRLDWFLRMMLQHPTFATHEMLWEFILVPDIQPEMMAARTKLKAETRTEKVREELAPLEDVGEVEQFVDYARELVRGISYATKAVIRRGSVLAVATADRYNAAGLLQRQVALLPFLPPQHVAAMEALVRALLVPQNHALAQFRAAFQAIQATVEAILVALGRPARIIQEIQAKRKQAERTYQSMSRATRWPLGLGGLLDDARQRQQDEREGRARQTLAEGDNLSRELRSTQQTVASELAGWQEMHDRVGRRAIRELARSMLVQERDRLEAMERALRRVRRADREGE